MEARIVGVFGGRTAEHRVEARGRGFAAHLPRYFVTGVPNPAVVLLHPGVVSGTCEPPGRVNRRRSTVPASRKGACWDVVASEEILNWY
jgi:hypothetical protein